MQVLDVALGLLAVLALCVFYAVQCRLPAALAPLAAVGTLLAAPGLLATVLPLRLVGALLYAACAALLVLTFVKNGPAACKVLADPAFLLFCGCAVFALCVLAVRRPLFSDWDEFSHWGTAVKMMKVNGALYTAHAGWYWTASQPPALPGFAWLVQYFGSFAPWKVFFAYDVVLFACFSSVLAMVSKKMAGFFVPVAVTLVILPFFFGTAQRTVYLSTGYMTAYADAVVGALFGGAVAFYYALRAAGRPGAYAALPLAALALCKDNLFALALLAAGMMAADTLFAVRAQHFRGWRLRKVWRAAGFFVAPLAAFFVWKAHVQAANLRNPVMQGAETGGSVGGGLAEAVREMFVPSARGDAFHNTLRDMASEFLSGKPWPASQAGSGIVTCALVLAVFGLAIGLAGTRAARVRAALAAGLSALGFLAYQFELFVYFAFLNPYGAGTPDYERYNEPFYIGWAMIALAVLALSLQTAPPGRAFAGRGAVTALAAGAAAMFCLNVLPGYSVLDYPDRDFDALRAEEARAVALAAEVEPGARVFFVSQGDDGGKWFRYHYYFQPVVLDYSEGGGTIVTKERDGVQFPIVFTPDELRAYLDGDRLHHGSGLPCGYILVEHADDEFVKSYAGLFTDGLAATEAGAPVLYRRGADGQFSPVAAKGGDAQ